MRDVINNQRVRFWLALGLFLAFGVGQAMAAAAGGGGAMPWDTPLTTIMTDLTGPVAYALSVFAILAAGILLIFGGEITGFLRGLVYVVLVVGLIGAAPNLYASLGFAGAVV